MAAFRYSGGGFRRANQRASNASRRARTLAKKNKLMTYGLLALAIGGYIAYKKGILTIKKS